MSARSAAAVAASLVAAGGIYVGVATNRSVTCVAVGQVVEIAYASRGAVHSERVRVGDDWGRLAQNAGDYGCMGRCGPGCPSRGPGLWTRDCLVHDVCSYRNASRLGPLDPSCGSAHVDTFDDVAAALIGRAGCDGAPAAGAAVQEPRR